MVKMKSKNNKGSALYYVMIMLIIVTLILSGTLYASYRNALITHNYSSGEEDYFKCDSALEALRGQLAARLDGKSYQGIYNMIGSNQDSNVDIFKSITVNNEDGTTNSIECLYVGNNNEEDAYFSISKCISNIYDENVKFVADFGGFKAAQEEIKDNNDNWIDTCVRIKDVVVECQTVRIKTDIVINIDPNEENLNVGVFESVEFQNYTIEAVTLPEAEVQSDESY